MGGFRAHDHENFMKFVKKSWQRDDQTGDGLEKHGLWELKNWTMTASRPIYDWVLLTVPIPFSHHYRPKWPLKYRYISEVLNQNRAPIELDFTGILSVILVDDKT